MDKKIKIDFFLVELPDDSSMSFHEIIKAVLKDKPRHSQRNVRSYDHFIRLQDTQAIKNLYIGTMLRIRMNDIPPVAGLDGSLQNLDLKKDQGLGEETFFLYSPKLRVILVQRNWNGVRASGLAYYFEQLSGITPIELTPVLEPDVVARLSRMNVIRNFVVKIARPDNAQIYKDQGLSMSSMVRLMNESSAAYAEFNLTMGRKKGSLSPENIIEQAKTILRIHSKDEKQVEKLIVSGKQYLDEPTETLDLLKHRVIETAFVREENRRLSSADCRENLLQVYLKRETALKEMFTPK